MPQRPRPMRADARRNRATILTAARELLAERGNATQMDEIAKRAGVGMGTLYRHFGSKRSLLTHMVADRFGRLAAMAEEVARAELDPDQEFDNVVRGYLASAREDAAFLLALLGTADFDWADLEGDKQRWSEAVTRVIERAVAARVVRSDFTTEDFPLVFGGLLATMHLRGDPEAVWQRHLDLVLDGVRARDHLGSTG